MTRIVGGIAGGRRLRTPPGERTRPTSDRVREALFSAMESALGSLQGMRFLDLYAGSGAVGLEAASRGAAQVTLVEQDRRAAEIAGANVREVRLTGVRVVRAPVRQFLAGVPAAYDVVFADPPYTVRGGEVEEVLGVLGAGGWLAPDALVVVERSARDAPLGWPEGYAPGRVRTYGETALASATWPGEPVG